MSTPHLLELSRRLDTTLNEFALTADANGQYPWQAAQQQKQQRRRVGGALVGAAAIGAGAYGAKKLNDRYGTKGVDGIITGGTDLINRADDKLKAGYGKAKDAASAGMAKAKDAMTPMMGKAKTAITAGATRAGAYGSKILKAGQQGYKQGGIKGMGSMAMRALRKVRFSRAEVLVELEAKLDGALQEFKA